MSDLYRVKRLPPYVFERVDKLKMRAREQARDVVDFGMGNPDMPTPEHIVDKLVEVVRRPGTNRYSASRGIAGLRRAQAAYYERRFGVRLDAETQVIATLGSKEGFANMAQALSAPGDVFMAPDPTYPIHTFGFLMSGAVIRHVELRAEEGFEEGYLAGLDRAVRHSVPKPVGVVVNFPSNPTAQVVDGAFYRELVSFARRHDLYILSDLAYAEIYFDGNPPPSVLEVPGAMERTVEFSSLSKTYAMPGWRVGFAVGNERMVAALARVKSYLDYGAFTPVQVAATEALNGDQSCIDEIRQIYRERRDVLVESFGRAGWEIPSPPATMFAWARPPEHMRHMSALDFTEVLIAEAGVAVSPGVGFGEHGEGWVRLALVENEQRIRQAARGVRRMLEARQAS